MKKIDLITGFLGAGKTTFLKKYVKYLVSKGEKVCILENDFGAVNVDMMLINELRSENVELEMVSGGCDADCHKRRFKTKLIAIGMDDYTRVIVEPSGVFDTDEFFDSLYDEPLCNWYEVGSVIGIVDAKITNFCSDEARYVLASEMASAGKIILSKTQYAEADDIENTKKYIEEALNSIQCDRDISGIFIEKEWDLYSDEDFETVRNASYHRSSFVKKSDAHDSFKSIYYLDKKLQVSDIKNITDKIINDKTYGNVIRLKGFCFGNGNWTEINADKTVFNTKDIAEGQDVIIIIGEKLNEEIIGEEVNKYAKKIN